MKFTYLFPKKKLIIILIHILYSLSNIIPFFKTIFFTHFIITSSLTAYIYILTPTTVSSIKFLIFLELPQPWLVKTIPFSFHHILLVEYTHLLYLIHYPIILFKIILLYLYLYNNKDTVIITLSFFLTISTNLFLTFSSTMIVVYNYTPLHI